MSTKEMSQDGKVPNQGRGILEKVFSQVDLEALSRTHRLSRCLTLARQIGLEAASKEDVARIFELKELLRTEYAQSVRALAVVAPSPAQPAIVDAPRKTSFLGRVMGGIKWTR